MRRVVVTGIGLLSSIGNGKEETWNNKSLWVVIDRKTERLNYKSAIPLLDLLTKSSQSLVSLAVNFLTVIFIDFLNN